MRKKRFWLTPFLLSMMLLAGCSNGSDQAASAQENSQGNKQTSTPAPTEETSNVPVKLIDLKYTAVNKGNLKSVMGHLGYNKIYIPYQDVSPNTMVTVGIKSLAMEIDYQWLRITESQFPLDYGNAKISSAHMKSTSTGKWVTVLDNRNNEVKFLTFEKDGLYIKLEDFRNISNHMVEAIADAFKPFP